MVLFVQTPASDGFGYYVQDTSGGGVVAMDCEMVATSRARMVECKDGRR